MKVDIKNRYTGQVKFTAEIEANDTTPLSLKIGLAVKWGIKNYADLSYADLSYADLRYADLRSADLSSANLRYANLSSANLRYADLSYADLRYADLRSANLIVIYGLMYAVIINNDEITIGCEIHKTKEWKGFTDSKIRNMDGDKALKSWKAHKQTIILLAESFEQGEVE